jgi:hypothetical protein
MNHPETHFESEGDGTYVVQKGKRRTAYVGYTMTEILEKEKERGD